MQFSCVLIPVAIFQLLIGLPAQTQNKSAPTQENTATRGALPKAISTPDPPYPEEARKKGIEGKVTLLIVIDAKGKVSQVKVLSGPEELVPAAVASVKMWQFEPPVLGPVTRTVEIAFGFPKECPGPIVIHATKSLSPGLDRAAIETVRFWRFKKIEGNAGVSLENLRLEFTFRATCNPRF